MPGQVLELVAQIAGVALGAGIVAVVAGRGTPPGAIRARVAAVAAAILGVAAVGEVRATADGIAEIRRTEPTEGHSAREECAAERGIHVGFSRWLARRMPAGSRYQLVMSDLFRARTADSCLQLLVLPATQTPDLGDADFIVFYEEVPSHVLEEARVNVGADPADLLLFDRENPDLALLPLRPQGERR